MFTTRSIRTLKKGSLVEITEEVQNIVAQSGSVHGGAVVRAPDTDAGLLCASFCDTHCAAHSKASVAGMSMDFIVEDGKLMLGGSQGIFLAEYCFPQLRAYSVAVMGV